MFSVKCFFAMTRARLFARAGRVRSAVAAGEDAGGWLGSSPPAPARPRESAALWRAPGTWAARRRQTPNLRLAMPMPSMGMTFM